MSRLVKALRFVGDLDDDFYADERQRDVWNEASAVGFQFFYWVALLTSAVLPWAAGRAGAWIALGLLITWLFGSAVTMTYARRHYVDPGSTENWLRPRVFLAAVVYLIGALGVVSELLLATGIGTWFGVVVGAAGGLVAAAWSVRRKRRRRAERDLLDEDF